MKPTARYTAYVPLDERDPATVRTAILARSSDESATPEDMADQVKQCHDFITAMGWQPTPAEHIFTEAKSGIRNVERPIIDQLLALAKSGAMDVVVAREFQRVDRKKMRRYQIIQTALDYGVEFRYANRAEDDGKEPDTRESRLIRDLLEEMGEIERDIIVERLGAYKRQRYVDGLPDGGRYGPLWGYAPGERRLAKHGKPMGLLSWVVDEEKAQHVRWLFNEVDRTPVAEVSLRRLAVTLTRKGIPTPAGKGRWSTTQVTSSLINPKYCGRGRVLRYKTAWTKQKDQRTGRVHDRRTITDRLHDSRLQHEPAKWLDGTYPIPETDVAPVWWTPVH